MIAAADDGGEGDFGRILIAQLMRPWVALIGRRTGAAVVILGITGRRFVACFAPVIPAVGCDVRAHIAVDEGHAGIRTPRAAQIGQGSHFRLHRGGRIGGCGIPGIDVAGELAVHKDKAVGMILRSAGGGDVSAITAVDLAVFKPGGGGAINEIDTSGHIAVAEVVAAIVDEECVLPADDAALHKHFAVTVGSKRQGLAVISGSVFDRETNGLEIIGEHGEAGVERVGAGGLGILDVTVPGEDGCGSVIAHKSKVGPVLWHDEWTLVGAGKNMNLDTIRALWAGAAAMACWTDLKSPAPVAETVRTLFSARQIPQRRFESRKRGIRRIGSP